MPSLSRLKSTIRYLRFSPPPRWRVVTRPCALRPAWRSLRSVRLRSGLFPFVSSSNEADWRKRRTGDVALYCFSGTFLDPFHEVLLDVLALADRDDGLLPIG